MSTAEDREREREKYEAFNVRDYRIWGEDLVLDGFPQEVLNDINNLKDYNDMLGIVSNGDYSSRLFGGTIIIRRKDSKMFLVEDKFRRNLVAELIDFGYDTFGIEKVLKCENLLAIK